MGRLARQWMGGALAALALGLTAIGATGVAPFEASSAERAGGKGALKPFASCERLRAYYRGHSRALPGGRRGGFESLSAADGDAATAAPGTGGGDETSAGSTNVQEAGVDEPDIVKAQGERVFAIAEGKLYAVAVGGPDPVVLGSVELPADSYGERELDDAQLFVHGDRALVIGRSYARWGTRWETPATLLAEIEVADPSRMRVVRTALAEGSYVSSRLTGSTARVVVGTGPPATVAERGRGRALVPRVRLRDRVARARTSAKLVGCDDVRRPARFAGAAMLTVLTIDLARGLPAVDADAVMTSGEVAYSSPTGLYVATQRWLGERVAARELSQVNTSIHRFDTSAPGVTEYDASGQVPGFMLSQWSMSEHDGVLRVASTAEPPWDGRDGERSQSFLTTLALDGDRLRQVGQVGGLGRGERIYAVRMIGERGYVVTFREVDPLYVLDLSDAARPRVLGELKVPGYSAYLHPVGDRYLLGVGQDADERGRTQGVQVSLFDVGDPAAPTRLDRESFGRRTYSEVEYDHHAFAYFDAHGLAVIPVASYGGDAGFAGAAGLRIDPASGDPVGRIAKIAHRGSDRIRRSLLVGERVYTLSDRGLAAHEPTTLAEVGFAPLSGR